MNGAKGGAFLTNAQPRKGDIEETTSENASFCKNTFRWVVDIDQWHPIEEHEGREFQFLLNLIQQEDEREQVLKYYHFADKKRALVSRLMTRAACAKARGCKFEEVVIGRTKGRKPFFKNVHEVAARTTTTNNGGSSSISNGNATMTMMRVVRIKMCPSPLPSATLDSIK